MYLDYSGKFTDMIMIKIKKRNEKMGMVLSNQRKREPSPLF